MDTKWRWPHAVATGLALGAVAYQSAVIWEMLDGVSTTTKLGVPLATVSAALLPVLAEAAWRAGERAKALLLALPVVVLMGFVLPSGISRLGEAQEARIATATVSTADRASIVADLDRSRKLVTQAEGWMAAECKSGAGSKCKGLQFILDQRKAGTAAIEARLATAKPAPAPWLPSWQPALLPIGLEVAILASLFFGMGPLTRIQAVAPPPAVQAIPASTVAPVPLVSMPLQITRADVEALKLAGMKQHDIASHYGLNQGRISELLSGKRDVVQIAA